MPSPVDALYAQMVETLARAGESDKNWAWLIDSVKELRRERARERLDEMGVPALVEALAEIAELDQDPDHPADVMDSCRLVGWQDAARIARAALGGEQVQR